MSDSNCEDCGKALRDCGCPTTKKLLKLEMELELLFIKEEASTLEAASVLLAFYLSLLLQNGVPPSQLKKILHESDIRYSESFRKMNERF